MMLSALSYPVMAFSFERYLFIIFSVTIGAVLGYCSLQAWWSWLLALAWLLWLVANVGYYQASRNWIDFTLVYQHKSWMQKINSYTESTPLEHFSVLIDWQELILIKAIRFKNGKKQPLWFWLQKKHCPTQWHSLRIRVFHNN